MANNSTGPLGQTTEYISRYAPELLFPIARQELRQRLGIEAPLPFVGVDIWTAYEVSWLLPGGKPAVALAEFQVPCESPYMVESKSFKLYLNSFNQTAFDGVEQVRDTLASDLSRVCGAAVQVQLQSLQAAARQQPLSALAGACLDDIPLRVERYTPAAELLSLDDSGAVVEETLYSDLLKSNCPVTGQPDWASVQVHYRGAAIDRASLLRYIISFREHQDFHEHCVERMFMDIQARCRPESLAVYARYTRRGGLDINPFRASEPGLVPQPCRLLRQ